MFVRNVAVPKVETKEIVLKSNTVVTINSNKRQADYHVLSNDGGVLVVQEVKCLSNVNVIQDHNNYMECGTDKTEILDIFIKIDQNTTPICFSCDYSKSRFVYQKEVITHVRQDARITTGDELSGYLNDDNDENHVAVTISAVSDEQLVLNYHDNDTDKSFFAVLDKDSIISDGDWKIFLENGNTLHLDSSDIRYTEAV
jgi:hypothetical protein